MTATETWYAFRAYNSETLYAFGTEEEANEYADLLNVDREINVYHAKPTTAVEAADHGIANLEYSGFSLDDALAAAKGLR